MQWVSSSSSVVRMVLEAWVAASWLRDVRHFVQFHHKNTICSSTNLAVVMGAYFELLTHLVMYKIQHAFSTSAQVMKTLKRNHTMNMTVVKIKVKVSLEHWHPPPPQLDQSKQRNTFLCITLALWCTSKLRRPWWNHQVTLLAGWTVLSILLLWLKAKLYRDNVLCIPELDKRPTLS